MGNKKELNIKIGERIKKSREQACLTQEKFAEIIDVSVQYVSDLERGKTGTSIPTLIKICNALHVSSDYLLFDRKESTHLSGLIGKLQTLPENELSIIEDGINILINALSEYKK